MTTLDIHGIFRHLPHRYPFLLLDRVLECAPGESLVALKNVTVNEPFFSGHFPDRPVMPGVLILEAMAQATGVLAFQTAGLTPDADTVYFLVGIDRARFKRTVYPGDQMILESRLLRSARGIWKFSAEARVDGHRVAEAEIMCAEREYPRD
ncbi:MAG TPA: 3-hydroxyacyl-ACP dehydratase FabZ [Gammaproteobacteria bacterium]|nr:3-hydroxyacyl-ACP dehydratase FabZ [Gammaproteobacteria bacterium]